jgi:hypothetical protein
MPEQLVNQTPSRPAFDPEDALRILEEAWAYYTPVPRCMMPEDQYTDIPIAA